MQITENKAGDVLTLVVEGRLDSLTAPDLEKTIFADLTGIKQLILDFTGLEYISSSGIRVLLKAQKTMSKQGSMKILHVTEMVNEVFDITGLSDILTIE